MPREYNNDDPNVFGHDEDMDEQEATDDGENFNNNSDKETKRNVLNHTDQQSLMNWVRPDF